jgi:hypothetical protein
MTQRTTAIPLAVVRIARSIGAAVINVVIAIWMVAAVLIIGTVVTGFIVDMAVLR